jgi:hypothetical protein
MCLFALKGTCGTAAEHNTAALDLKHLVGCKSGPGIDAHMGAMRMDIFCTNSIHTLTCYNR